MTHDLETHIVKALKRSDAGGTNGDSTTLMSNEFLYGVSSHADKLCMHLMPLYLLTLHWLEGSCSHMEGQLLTIDAMSIDISQNLWCKMQSGSRSSHTALDLRINRLIGGFVTLLSLTIKVRGNRQFSHSVNDLCKGDVVAIPLEGDRMTGSMNSTSGG